MRIAHFSDVHAFTLAGARPWHFLSKRLAGWVNLELNRRARHGLPLFEALVEDLNRRPPDEVIVTGDLTNLSLAGEFALARGVLDRIALGPAHVTVVPGNHDVYTWDALLGRRFRRAFAPYARDDAGHLGFPLVRRRGAVAIVGVSTAFPSPVPFADGWLGPWQLARLRRALVGLEGTFRVLAMHHPPYANRAHALRGLRDRAALQALLRDVGCELVIHGHEHRSLRRELEGPHGPIPVIGVSSGTYRDARPDRRARYHVYEVTDGRLASVEERAFDPETGHFA